MTGPEFIVTGSGRCGTHYCARLLNALGTPTGHECFLPADKPGQESHPNPVGEVGWPILARISEYQGKIPIVALVRDPARVVNSFYHTAKQHQNQDLIDVPWAMTYQRLFQPETDFSDPLGFAMEWVANLTWRAIRAADGVVRAEDLQHQVGVLHLMSILQLPIRRSVEDAIRYALDQPGRMYANQQEIHLSHVIWRGGPHARAIERLAREYYAARDGSIE